MCIDKKLLYYVLVLFLFFSDKLKKQQLVNYDHNTYIFADRNKEPYYTLELMALGRRSKVNLKTNGFAT